MEPFRKEKPTMIAPKEMHTDAILDALEIISKQIDQLGGRVDYLVQQEANVDYLIQQEADKEGG